MAEHSREADLSVLFLPSSDRHAAIKPKIMERRFRVSFRCTHCDAETAIVVLMADEPNDPATVEDFAGSGALDLIDEECRRCYEDLTLVTRIEYMRTPEESRSAV